MTIEYADPVRLGCLVKVLDLHDYPHRNIHAYSKRECADAMKFRLQYGHLAGAEQLVQPTALWWSVFVLTKVNSLVYRTLCERRLLDDRG